MADRYKAAKQRATVARREKEAQNDTYAYANSGRWIKPPQDATCVTCKFGFHKWGYATVKIVNGAEAYAHRSGADCSNAFYAWRESR